MGFKVQRVFRLPSVEEVLGLLGFKFRAFRVHIVCFIVIGIRG